MDCTSGWYAEQDWTGVPVSSPFRSTATARSLPGHSATGYWIRLPVPTWIACCSPRARAARHSADHGFPPRLVAPGRRGYWWVKWVERIELESTPSWWQPPFPAGCRRLGGRAAPELVSARQQPACGSPGRRAEARNWALPGQPDDGLGRCYR